MRIKFFLISVSRAAQVILLVILLVAGWTVFGVLKFFKGNNWAKNQKSHQDIFGIDSAQADVPGGSSSGGGGSSTPFLSIWNGKEYKIENDILFSKPRSEFSNCAYGRREYEAKRVSPDLYKIQTPFKLKDGKISFQIQEIEPEESFFSGLNLLRGVHPANSEIIVDSEFRRFYVLEKDYLNKNLVKPEFISDQGGKNVEYLSNESNLWKSPVKESFFDKNNYLDLKYKNLDQIQNNFLVVKSRLRVWVMGEDRSVVAEAKYLAKAFIGSKILPKVAVASAAIFGLWLFEKLNYTGILSPLFALGGCGSGSSDCGGSNRCLEVFYKSQNGNYHHVSTVEPRGWGYSTELLEVPREAISHSGEVNLRIVATERHFVGFLGLVKQPKEVHCELESLGMKKAYHYRARQEYSDLTKNQAVRYLHTIPGDVVDVEFELPKLSKALEGKKETYLIRASGFYTRLSPESKKLAGKWTEKLGAEAKERLAILRKEGLIING